jgi:hypothetical protein
MITTMQRRKALFGGLAFVLVLAIVAGIFGVFGSSGDSSDQYPANYASTEETR